MDESDNEPIDWSIFASIRAELGAGFVRIVGYFREDGETSVARIEAAMRRQDTAGIVLPAHRLKTEARQFGAEALGELSEEIEFAARRAMELRVFPDNLIPAVTRLRRLYNETSILLEAEINPLVQRRGSFGRDEANQDFGRL